MSLFSVPAFSVTRVDSYTAFIPRYAVNKLERKEFEAPTIHILLLHGLYDLRTRDA